MPGSALVGDWLECAVLLLLLILNISRISVRKSLKFLRSVIDAGLWFILSAFVVNLRLEHSLGLVGGPAFEDELLVGINGTLSVLVEV